VNLWTFSEDLELIISASTPISAFEHCPKPDKKLSETPIFFNLRLRVLADNVSKESGG
jgi:hypothetical protein